MSVLLLRLAGPLQSWGTSSRFFERDTEREPTKSGVVGLLAAALGIPRSGESPAGVPTIDKLASLTMGVRVDREGVLLRDFQTAGGGVPPEGTRGGVAKAESGKAGDVLISNRYYLADAVFLVGLEGPGEVLERIDVALRAPRWPLFLGRRSCPPGQDVRLPDGLRPTGRLELELERYEWLGANGRELNPPERVRMILDSSAAVGGRVRMDVPLSFVSTARRYGPRYVRDEFIRFGPQSEGATE